MPAARNAVNAPPQPGGPVAQSCAGRWIAYFEANAGAWSARPLHGSANLNEAERAAIADSIAMFQLGESGGGTHVRRAAKAYVALGGEAAYMEALALFIAEEQRHGAELGRFMDAAGLARWKRCTTDGCFRSLRHTGGLERAIAVLLTAEIIAQVYYRALRSATNSSWLRALCTRILRDEAAHIAFQTERLALLRRSCGPCARAWRNALHRLLFAAAVSWVYVTHGPCLRAGGFPLKRFWRACWSRYRMAHARWNDPAHPTQALRP
ncbi:MAG: membrane protein [Planctomycetota bacterium]